MSKKTRQACIFIGVGFILILISVIMHIAHGVKTDNEVLILAFEIIKNLLSHIGIGFLAIGIISTMLDMGHWAQYFEERLSKIVIDKKYLRSLDQNSLISLQTEVLKSYFKNDDIGGADGFLQYYQKNLQSIVGMPYRESVNMFMQISEYSEKTECLLVNETLSYICKSNSGKIQNKVYYQPEPNEHFETLDFSVSLQHEKIIDTTNNGKKFYTSNDLITMKACTKKEDGFALPIKDFNFNGLMVTIKATYLISESRFIAWRMAQPSKNITVNINFPSTFYMEKELFINNDELLSESIENINGSYYATINGWLMPEEGLTFQLLKKGN